MSIVPIGRFAPGDRNVWQSVDLLLVPTIPRPRLIAEAAADPIGVNSELGAYTNFVNLRRGATTSSVPSSRLARPRGHSARTASGGYRFLDQHVRLSSAPFCDIGKSRSGPLAALTQISVRHPDCSGCWRRRHACLCWQHRSRSVAMPLDEKRPFLAVNIALLTVSDTRSEADDRSGRVLAELAKTAGHRVVARRIVRDEQEAIVAQLNAWIADRQVDVVIATGGTGVTGRDVTPEAFHSVYEKEIAGFGELFRWLSFQKIGPSTIQSRATAGVAGGTYLFALPGSPGACRDAWDGILVHQLDNRFRPCNFVELMPRLLEQ
jgi:molybdenum cofactor biosynthesis protein B